MTQASIASRPVATAPLRSSGGETAGDLSEDPDSPGPHARAGSPPASPPATPRPAAPFPDRLNDPLAEPVAALLGTALALLSLAVPLLAVLAEGRAEATGRVPASERIDHRPAPRGASGP